MKRRLNQAEVDRIRAEYDQWDKFGADSESATELAKRLGVSKATLYRLKERHWRVDGKPGNNGNVAATATLDVPTAASMDDLATVVRWLSSELVAARVEIAELRRELGRD
jgi:hypothetical protein